jgi:hypothetical protein
MNAYRLETFTPASGPWRGRPNPIEQRVEAAREEAYHAGFLAGQAMAVEGFLEDQSRLTSELVEAIADARLTNEAARRHVIAGLAPMIESLAAAITPALAQAGLAAEIARLVERAVMQIPGARPRLRCAPEMVDTVAARLEERGLAAIVEEAPELLPREAQVFWDQGYDHLDLDACVAQIRACIASHLSSNAGEDDDPRRYG